MSFVETLKDAHVRSHRVGHDCNNLSPKEQEVFDQLLQENKNTRTEDGITARLEPKRFGVNWRRELLDTQGGEDRVRKLTAEAKARTDDARRKFKEEDGHWSKATLKNMRLTIEG